MDSTLQSRLHMWRKRNFPESNADQQLLGVVEEVGELAHAILKGKQGIRGMDNEAKRMAAVRDAVGDIQIFLAGFCSYEGINMLCEYEDTAREVMKRDFVNYPNTGFPPEGPGYSEQQDNPPANGPQ